VPDSGAIPRVDAQDLRISATSPPTPDGDRWVADSAARRNGHPPPVRRLGLDRLVVLGYITAVSMPPIGFILALAIALRPPRRQAKHAVLIFGLGILACLMWVVLIGSGALTSTDNTF
jgi:hypothetical protein